MNSNGKRKNSVEVIKRLIKRLPEMIVITFLILAGVSMWMETENAKYATAFLYHSLFERAFDLDYIPLSQKLLYTIPATILVFLFAEDIIKVSVKNEGLTDEPMQIT